MADASKFTDKASELFGQAAAAAGPLKDKATELAAQAAAATAPIAAQAKERATTLAGQAAAAAGPITEQARVKAAQGVDVIADNLDKLTGGKYSDQIHTVASKVEGALDGKSAPAPTDPTLRAETAPLKSDTPPLHTDD